uniref:Uncharacterized protein n=1 Tax=Heterorhabditis bacteriophora TaxID=37862 RepID=A0A1I7W9Q4_HETBA
MNQIARKSMFLLLEYLCARYCVDMDENANTPEFLVFNLKN